MVKNMRIESDYSVRSDPALRGRSGSAAGKAEPEAEEPQVRQSDAAETGATNRLSPEEQKELAELKKTDRKVRQHEQAHLAAAAGLAVSGAQFEYKRGPDGVMYAVGGEVNIDTSPVRGDPRATLEKAQRIERAAQAPADPSAQDRKVAAQARQMAAQARLDLLKESQSAGVQPVPVQADEAEAPQAGRYLDVQA